MNVLRTVSAIGLASLIGTGPCLAADGPPGGGVDWHDVGYRDGTEGLDPSRTPDLPNDRAAYRRGWAEGIADFCSHDSGLERGLAGESALPVCPAVHEADFRRGWTEGRRLWRAEREIAELEDLLVEQSRRLLQIGDVLATTERHLVRADAGAEERARWLEETKRLTTEQRDIAADVDALEFDIRSRKEALASLRFRLADAG